MKLSKVTIQDVLVNLPDIVTLDFNGFSNSENFDFYIQAVGFEARTLGIAEKLNQKNVSKKKSRVIIDEAVLISYKTNVEDNKYHLDKLISLLKPISSLNTILDLNDSFDDIIRNKIESILKAKTKLRILLDISTMSSRLVLFLTKLLFKKGIDLTIVFTEAETYFPTEESYKKMKKNEENAIKNAQTSGIGKVFISPDYNGAAKENQDLIICFPSFSAERTEAVISYIDDLILKQRDNQRLIWIVGEPHFGDDATKEKRKNMQIEINKINSNEMTYTICTFDYKKTLAILDQIYKDSYANYHINISDLGSKMQSLGIALFCNLRRDVTVYYSEPVTYNSLQYSKGIKDYWMIPIGPTDKFLKELFRVDTIQFNPDSTGALN